MYALVALIAVSPVVGLAILTGLGQRRRGVRPLTVAMAGVFFPVTWVGWYVRDRRHDIVAGGAAQRFS